MNIEIVTNLAGFLHQDGLETVTLPAGAAVMGLCPDQLKPSVGTVLCPEF